MGRDRSRSMSSSSSGRGIQSATWNGEQGYRVHVSDLAAGVSRKEIERMFSKYGTINEVWVATNPPCFAFVNFKHRSDADKAIREIDGKIIGSTRVGASWARARTYGGRNRGGRGAPYGSYRSSTGGSRRRSRSRSQDNSRHKRRRSRSRDRHHRRSVSPRDRKRSRNENNERKDNREKSKTSRSISRSRSRSHSTSRKQNQSRDSSVNNNDNDNDNISPSAIRSDDQSPLIAGDE